MLECLERTLFPAYGTLKSIVSENARVFCCKSFKYLCFRWGIQHVITTPYYPQASLVDGVIRNLKADLKNFHDIQEKWDEDFSWLSMVFNTAVHKSTRSTPDVLFLGREMKCPLAVRWVLGPVNSGQVDPPRIDPFGPEPINISNMPARRLRPISLRRGILLDIV